MKTVPQVAELLQVSPAKIRTWITSGRMPAINVNLPGVRASYRISEDGLREFEALSRVNVRPHVLAHSAHAGVRKTLTING